MFILCLLLKLTFLINNHGFTDTYVIVMLRDSGSFHRLKGMFKLAFKFCVTYIHINQLLKVYM